jgi:hypothetical protein
MREGFGDDGIGLSGAKAAFHQVIGRLGHGGCRRQHDERYERDRHFRQFEHCSSPPGIGASRLEL